MTTVRESLETQLQERWDPTTLEVYGDHLQSLGDPRGELITIDREIRTGRVLDDRKREVLRAWLGGETLGGRTWQPRWFHDGFVHLSLFEREDLPFLRAFLSSPAGPYLRSLQLVSTSEDIVRALELLGDWRHPWLSRLGISPCVRPGQERLPTIEASSAFVVATPRLHTLSLGCAGVLSFAHPALRRLELWGLASAGLLGGVMPGIVEVELHFGPAQDFDASAWAPWFGQQALPALRRLDLSPNEQPPTRELSPTERRSPWIGLSCNFVAALEGRERLTRLVLPSLRSYEDAERVRQLLAAMPGIAELSFGRRYACFDTCHATLDHPALVLPPSLPWPFDPPPTYYVHVTFGDGARFELSYVWLLSGIYLDGLAEPVRHSLLELRSVLGELELAADPRRAVSFPARTLARAMQAIVRPEPLTMYSRPLDHCAVAILRRAIGDDEAVELRWDRDDSYDPYRTSDS